MCGAGTLARGVSVHLLGNFRQLCFRLSQQAVTNLSYPLQVPLALCLLLFNFELLEPFLQLPRARNQVLFLFPLGFECIRLLPYLGKLFVHIGQPLARVWVVLFL